MRVRSPLLIVAGSVAAIVAVLALTLTFMDWNLFKGAIERSASAHLGRAVHIAGPLHVQWSRNPTITLTGLTIGNAPWEPSRPLLRVDWAQAQLELAPLLAGHLVFRHVALRRPEVYLHRERSGRANWTFENQAPNETPLPAPVHLPVMRDLVVDGGHLELVDEVRRLKVAGTLEARPEASASDPKPFHLAGTGSINEQPFKLDVNGGPLRALTADAPYPFALAITAGDNRIEAQGKLLRPFDLAELELQVTASGRDLAELFYLTQITLPNSPPFRITAQITRHGVKTAVREIAGSFGASDVSGTVDIDASTKRPHVKAELASRRLLLRDFAAVTGDQARGSQSLAARQPAPPAGGRSGQRAAPPADDAPRLFPDAHLQVDRLRAIDAEVHFRATAVDAGTVPVTGLDINARLDDGVLTLRPLQFDFAQGRIVTDIRMDGGEQPPKVHADLRARNIQLSQFKSRGATATAPLDGLLDGHGVVDGRGDSVREVLADANGRFTIVVPSGDIESEFAELAGVDVAEGLGLALKQSGDRSPIRCGAAQFEVQNGVANAQDLAFDTQNVLINGSGRIYLGSERLDLTIEGHPKKFRLLRVRAPIEVRGLLLRPKFQLETGHALKNVAIGAALGAVGTPFAALLAFVDPGLAKDQNCAQLLTPPSAAANPPTAGR